MLPTGPRMGDAAAGPAAEAGPVGQWAPRGECGYFTEPLIRPATKYFPSTT